MKIFTTAAEMTAFSTENKSRKRTVGFVPTMGALHKGHISLVKYAQRNCDLVVVSVFVNPTQFNSSEDLNKYPRMFDKDRILLHKEGVDVMFAPSVNEVYPTEEPVSYNLDGLDKYMEGPNRPGHFSGVVQVVSRLFDIVEPEYAIFGEKDFQQLAIIKHMSSKLGYSTIVVGCPTVREPSGLAMSSRNQRLSENGKITSQAIHQTLVELKHDINSGIAPTEAKKKAISELSETTGLELEYLELVHPQTLQPVVDSAEIMQACIAVWVEDVRLIDNMRVK